MTSMHPKELLNDTRTHLTEVLDDESMVETQTRLYERKLQGAADSREETEKDSCAFDRYLAESLAKYCSRSWEERVKDHDILALRALWERAESAAKSSRRPDSAARLFLSRARDRLPVLTVGGMRLTSETFLRNDLGQKLTGLSLATPRQGGIEACGPGQDFVRSSAGASLSQALFPMIAWQAAREWSSPSGRPAQEVFYEIIQSNAAFNGGQLESTYSGARELLSQADFHVFHRQMFEWQDEQIARRKATLANRLWQARERIDNQKNAGSLYLEWGTCHRDFARHGQPSQDDPDWFLLIFSTTSGAFDPLERGLLLKKDDRRAEQIKEGAKREFKLRADTYRNGYFNLLLEALEAGARIIYQVHFSETCRQIKDDLEDEGRGIDTRVIADNLMPFLAYPNFGLCAANFDFGAVPWRRYITVASPTYLGISMRDKKDLAIDRGFTEGPIWQGFTVKGDLPNLGNSLGTHLVSKQDQARPKDLRSVFWAACELALPPSDFLSHEADWLYRLYDTLEDPGVFWFKRPSWLGGPDRKACSEQAPEIARWAADLVVGYLSRCHGNP